MRMASDLTVRFISGTSASRALISADRLPLGTIWYETNTLSFYSVVPAIIGHQYVVSGGSSTPTGPANTIAFFNGGGTLTGDALQATISAGIATFSGVNVGFAPTQSTIDTQATATRAFHLPNMSGTAVIANDATGLVLIGAITQLNGSNAGIQYSSATSNRGSIRVNQYEANAGVPGITGFKSRGAIGVNTSVNVGDTLARITAFGVTGNNIDLPLSGYAGFNVTAVNPNSLGTEFAVETVANDGAINSHRPTFAVAGSGLLRVREDLNGMSGIAVTGAGGTAVVSNTRITANTRIQLTIQDGGAIPTAAVYLNSRTVGFNFTIQSLSVTDVGVNVYYQLWEPIP